MKTLPFVALTITVEAVGVVCWPATSVRLIAGKRVGLGSVAGGETVAGAEGIALEVGSAVRTGPQAGAATASSMLRHANRIACLSMLLAVAAPACGPVRTALPTSNATPSAPATVSAPATLPSPSRLPAINLTEVAGQPTTPTASTVMVRATNGNVFIRRGPDLGFNPISVLMEGQSADAMARDVLGDWLQVPLPGKPNQTGWVSIQTQFTTVSGDLKVLPEIQPTYFPVPASLRNCTHHQMLITPGNITLPAVDNFPANDVQVNPGAYVILDTDVDGSPEVLKVQVSEGSAVDVHLDGSGEKRKCPVP